MNFSSKYKIFPVIMILAALLLNNSACSFSWKDGEGQLPGLADDEKLPLPDSDTAGEVPELLSQREFYIHDRSSGSGTGVDSYYSVQTVVLAVSDHFVFYSETVDGVSVSEDDAEYFLAELEKGYETLRNVYGAGTSPDLRKNGRISILACDIKDDYTALNPGYISGFFAPRDLFADSFTSELCVNPSLLDNEYPLLAKRETASNLQGRSNEDQVVYIDIHPFYDGTASGSKEISRELFVETAVHELSHLFVYYKRVIDLRIPNLLPWISEGLAEQAPILALNRFASMNERLCQMALPSVKLKLAGGPSVLDLNSSGDPVVGYIQANLFFNYLKQRSGSEFGALILGIVTETIESVSGLEKILSAYPLPDGADSFRNIFRDWAVTNWLYSTGNSLAQPSEIFSYQGAGIGKAGADLPAFPAGTTLYHGEKPVILKPASYISFKYTVNGNEDDFNPSLNGMEEGMGIALIRIKTGSDSTIDFYKYNDAVPVSTFAEGEEIVFILYNPNITNTPLSSGLLSWDTALDTEPDPDPNPDPPLTIGEWLGGGYTGWQSIAGAAQGNNGGWFNRTTGAALSMTYINGGAKNYIYVSDSQHNGISRWNVDTGEFEGRMGSTVNSADCSGDSAELDGWNSNSGLLTGNYCRRNLNSPQGIAVDSSGNIYIADKGNHRIVKRDRDGNFTAWLGHPTDDTWQTADKSPGIAPTQLLNQEGVQTNTRMFYSPWSIAIDEASDYMYISCYGTSRVVRRRLSTGAFLGFIGNGKSEWSTLESQDGHRSSYPKYFNYPRGITVDDNYIYIADEQNNRVSRWTRAGSIGEAGGGTGYWMGGAVDIWHSGATAKGINGDKQSFVYPADVAALGEYLYISDRTNQRIVRRRISDGSFAGWIGGGAVKWRYVDGPSLEALVDTLSQPLIMIEPLSVVISPKHAQGPVYDYLYFTTTYNKRLSRVNLDYLGN